MIAAAQKSISFGAFGPSLDVIGIQRNRFGELVYGLLEFSLDTLAARGIHGFLDMKRIHAEKAPLQRNISADEVAKTALFLCSDLSSGITGSIIPVDAGYHIMAV